MTSEEKVRKRYKNAIIGEVIGTRIYRVYKNDRCRTPDRLSEDDGSRERAWDKAAANLGGPTR